MGHPVCFAQPERLLVTSLIGLPNRSSEVIPVRIRLRPPTGTRLAKPHAVVAVVTGCNEDWVAIYCQCYGIGPDKYAQAVPTSCALHVGCRDLRIDTAVLVRTLLYFSVRRCRARPRSNTHRNVLCSDRCRVRGHGVVETELLILSLLTRRHVVEPDHERTFLW